MMLYSVLVFAAADLSVAVAASSSHASFSWAPIVSMSLSSAVRRVCRFSRGRSWAEDDPWCSALVTWTMSRPSSSFTNEFIRGCCLRVVSGSGGPKVSRPSLPVLSPRQGSPSRCCLCLGIAGMCTRPSEPRPRRDLLNRDRDETQDPCLRDREETETFKILSETRPRRDV